METAEQEDWIEEYREEHMKYNGELDKENEAFSAKLESLLQAIKVQGSRKIREHFGKICTLPRNYRVPAVRNGRSARTTNTNYQNRKNCHEIGRRTAVLSQIHQGNDQSSKTFVHYCKLWGVPIPKVMVDGGAAINLLPHRLLVKMGRTENDLIPTRLTVTNFAGALLRLMEY
ncbi:unnamed protein product [Prunus armeniaca]